MGRRRKNTKSSNANEAKPSGNPLIGRICMIAAVAVGVFALNGFIRSRWTGETDVPVPPTIDASSGEVDPAIVEAVRVARQQVVDSPQSVERWGHLGKVFSAHGFNESAETCFSVASRLAPTNQRWAYLYARCRLNSAPAEAMDLLERCVDLKSDGINSPRLFLIEKLLENQQLDAAEEHLRLALAENPNNPRARFAQARLHFMREEYEECKSLIIDTHHNITTSYQAAVDQAKTLAANGQTTDAKAVIDAANGRLRASLCQQQTIGSMLAAALLRVGEIEASGKQQELAKSQPDTPWPDPYTEGISALATGLRSMLSKSDIAHSNGQYIEALAILEKAVTDYPDSEFAHIRLARTLIHLARVDGPKNAEAAARRYEEARRHLMAALEINANSVEGHFRLGVLCLYWSDLDADSEKLHDAEQWFQKAISIKPDFEMAHFNLAKCLDKQGRTNAAIAAMRQALVFDPNHVPARRALGGLLMKAGDLQGAIAELERTIQQKPGDKKAREWLEMIRRDLRLRGVHDASID